MLGTDLPTNPWPACGEIDIMEMRGDLPRRLYGTVHGPNYFGEHGKGRVWDQEIDLTDDFHTYAIDWLPGKISWFLDGEEFHEVSRADVAPDEWVFDHEFYLVMNLAMGGHFTSAIDPSLNSAEFRLDYVRHFSIDGVGAAIVNSA
jgi:beta-glucanase (GH16 family)